ncbi:g8757 [Coccomyxa viridis]|uniref:G8757 protein n=1 Tax=Coccomyxa viridis TaxID=1274662 RepID=A0ABP1G163_9CHLO
MHKHQRSYTDDSEEYKEKLRLFTKNAEFVREMNATYNADKSEGEDIFALANYEYADMIDLTDCAPGAILFSDFEDDCMDILSKLPPDKDPEVHHDPMRNGSTHEKRLEQALRVVANKRFAVVAEHDPEAAFMVWMHKHQKSYTEGSKEYAKILKLFKKNAACVRRLNAEYNPGGDPDEVRVLCL